MSDGSGRSDRLDSAAAPPLSGPSGLPPLVLLDIDGVVNDGAMLRAIRTAPDPEARAERLGIKLITSHGHRVAIPRYMPGLIQALVDECEVWWCTTWRQRANDEIATHLGIEPLPVIDDGTQSTGVAWKAAAAKSLIEAARTDGRAVVWIEDFNGALPDIDGVTFIDTGPQGVLQSADLDIETLDSLE
jgi:hypothetical protein